MSQTPSLLDSIRRTIEERNLFSARSRLHFVSALKNANYYESCTPTGKGSKNFKSPMSGLSDNRLIRLRNKVIQEIIKTEEVYVNQLKTVRDEWMNFTELKICFSRRDFNVIFSSILTLLEVNEKLMQELKGEINGETSTLEDQPGTSLQAVAEAFKNYTPYLKLYSTYAAGYQQADTMLQKLVSQSPDIRALVKAKEEKLNNTLQSYLIVPVQRIPRYIMLLKQLIGFIGAAGKSDSHVQSLLESIKNLEQVASHINESVRKHENSCKLLEINKWMGKYYHGNLVEPGRDLIKAGIVQKPPNITLPHSLTPNNHFYLILLNDQIIACKIKSELGSKGCIQPNLVLPLKKCTARILNADAEVECENEFIRFTLSDADDLSEWVRLINEAKMSLKRRAATLKKACSSNAQPMRKEEIKKILKANKTATKRAASATPSESSPTPGKMRKFLNISERLDEISNYLSPIRRTPSSPGSRKKFKRRSVTQQSTPLPNAYFDSSPQLENVNNVGRLRSLHVSKLPNTSCTIL